MILFGPNLKFLVSFKTLFFSQTILNHSVRDIQRKANWWLQPVWKKYLSNWIISPKVGFNIKNIWNHRPFTPWKTNMPPENQWLEDVFPIETIPFLGDVFFHVFLCAPRLVLPRNSWLSVLGFLEAFSIATSTSAPRGHRLSWKFAGMLGKEESPNIKGFTTMPYASEIWRMISWK